MVGQIRMITRPLSSFQIRSTLVPTSVESKKRFLTPLSRHYQEDATRSLRAKIIRLAMLAALTVTLSHCTNPEDTVSLTPHSTDEVGILVDGTKGGAEVRDQVFRGSPGEQIAIGNFTAGTKTVIAYTQGYAPTLAGASSDPTTWTSGSDNPSVPLETEHPIRVVFWIVKAPFAPKGVEKAKEFIHTTNMIWSKEAQGLRLITEQEDSTVIQDATAKKNSKGIDLAPFLGSIGEPVGCANLDIKNNDTGVGSDENAINVYYVKYVTTDNKSPSKNMATACKLTSPYWILLGEDTDGDVLAHELGHLLNLAHIDGDNVKDHFDKKNVMYPAPHTLATFLTEGQTLRSIVSDGSIVNSFFFPLRRPKLSEIKCSDDIGIKINTTATEKDGVCPPLWIRIWADEGTGGHTWEPDLCWKGCGAPVNMQVASQPMTSSTALPPEVSDALQYHLDVRCLVPEKGQPMRKPLAELLDVTKQSKAEKALEDRLLALLIPGPDKDLFKKIEEEVAAEWADLQRFQNNYRKKNQTAPPVLAKTKDDYLRERVGKIKQRYRERSAVVLLAMNSPRGVRAVKQEAANDEALRDLFEQFKGTGSSTPSPPKNLDVH